MDAQKETTTFQFEVPHRELISVTDTWKIGKDCEMVDGTGDHDGKYRNYRPVFANIPAAALLLSDEPTFGSQPDETKVTTWEGKVIELKNMDFGATLRIHDKTKFSDNTGILTACFH